MSENATAPYEMQWNAERGLWSVRTFNDEGGVVYVFHCKEKQMAEDIARIIGAHDELVDGIKKVLKYGVHHEMADTLRTAVLNAEGKS